MSLATVALSVSIAGGASAQPVRPRFIILVDSSGSMTENARRVRSHGDGSELHPGCDLDGNGQFDDSKVFQAKLALQDTIVAFGSAEFALARYRQSELGQPCASGAECLALDLGANVCVAGRCAYSVPASTTDYNECTGGTASGNGCIRCADPANDPTHVFVNGNTCCSPGDPRSGGFGMAGDVLVGFPPAAGSNVNELLGWIDGKETFPEGPNRELRATGTTPIGGSLNAVRDWLTSDTSPVGSAGGILNRDPLVACRSYNVILVTDGLEIAQCARACGINGTRAAELLSHSCTHGGQWDPVDERCEISGSPQGTTEVRVKTYVVGYTVNDPSLNAIAAAGGTGTALLANDGAELTARLSDIVAASIAAERCDCQDNTCDGEIDESFPRKGQPCTVGVGRCKRQGTQGCQADGSGLVCASSPSGTCPAVPLLPGEAAVEVCGAAPGCEAPTAEDCADDDCDGLIDENMSCMCSSKPETCNGIDDDCNGRVDDVMPVPCGLAIGECRPGTTACVDDGQGGKITVCQGGAEPTPEACDGRDNDCDGVVDGFGLACYPANTGGCRLDVAPQSCEAAPGGAWVCQGACQPGLLTCADGQCSACLGAIVPGVEVACDEADNDCDGEVDEGFSIGGPCGPGMSGVGECRPGILTCDGPHLECQGGVAPTEEVCNGKDDDCSGVVDDLPGVCGIIRGECRPGRWRCQDGQPVCEQVQGPQPELCNGKDDDCDGEIDEEVTDSDLSTPTACGGTTGICRPGVWKCSGGVKFCEGSVPPEPERCNGIDDNCDGRVDDSLSPPGPCPPPGLPPGSAVVGECRPGANVCAPMSGGGAGWQCMGGVGPAPETCDGQDNDCDGRVDNEAFCPAGSGCADGECAPACGQREFACPADRVCRDGLCVHSECVRRACPAGLSCDPRRGCIDRCEGVACPQGTFCQQGVCTSCHVTGCPAGEICRGARCERDPCAGVRCVGGSYCSDGTCLKSCAGVRCAAGQSCRRGVCVADRCRGVSCGGGQFCDPDTGRCQANPCDLIQCVRGQVCVPEDEACRPDTCAVTVCGKEDACLVRAGGQAECVDRRLLPGAQSIHVAAGRGCGCHVGGRAPGNGAGLASTLIVFIVLGWGWHRARRSRRAPRDLG